MIPESLEAVARRLVEGQHQTVDLREFAKGMKASKRASPSSEIEDDIFENEELVSFQDLTQ